jgi:hypothetical protein
MTTAVALGAAIVAVSRAIQEPAAVPEWCVYVAFVSLVVTFLLGGATRVHWLVVAVGDRGQIVFLNDEYKDARGKLHRMAKSPCKPEAAAVAETEVAEEAGVVAKTEVLRLWRSRAERDRIVTLSKWSILKWSGTSLFVAISALVVIGVDVLGQIR